MGKDVIAQAQSGTGKTATFAISILQQVDTTVSACQALVLAPTRELAQQIVKVIQQLGDFVRVKVHACVGGTAVREDIRILQDEGVHVVVGETYPNCFHLSPYSLVFYSLLPTLRHTLPSAILSRWS